MRAILGGGDCGPCVDGSTGSGQGGDGHPPAPGESGAVQRAIQLGFRGRSETGGRPAEERQGYCTSGQAAGPNGRSYVRRRSRTAAHYRSCPTPRCGRSRQGCSHAQPEETVQS